MQLTIDLPEPAFQRLSRLAELTNRPLSELAIQSIAGNLPPEIATTPVDIQAELLAMQKMDGVALRQIAQSQIAPPQQHRHLTLLERNQEGQLSDQEHQELQDLGLAADRLMLKKAHACALLRWLGQPIRDLNQLSPS
jgi:hypothetical protein